MANEQFDAVIVGSGFGGSVMAYRLADAGLNVCLLERGKAYPPGSFPRTPSQVKRSFWDPSEGLYGMFDLWSFDQFESLISSGLGGGSLIYANVLLRKDEKWFVTEDINGGGHEYWPVSRADLDPHYDRVEEKMNVQYYPLDDEPYDRTPKTNGLRRAARELGLDWERVPLAVTFANDGERPVPGEPIHEEHRNLHDRTRSTCRLCGECDLGCNYGSKNTLDYNYLSAAKRAGADIRTLHEVRSFKPRPGGGYEISYVVHDESREGTVMNTRSLPLQQIGAARLILSAGTMGSTFLMLKSLPHLGAVSEKLGTRFCGNGDLLGFALNARTPDPHQGGFRHRDLDPTYGPVITSTIRMGDALDGDGSTGRGFYLQDAGYPGFMSWLVESADIFSATKRYTRLLGRIISARLRDDTNLSAEMQNLIGDAFSSSNLPLLGMGRDIPDGQMRLGEANRLRCDWRLKGSEDYFDRLKQTMEDVADALDADFAINPTWLLKRVITVHPLGGCPMGRTEQEGVVDEYGQVFNHPDLYVADGSIMPGPVGPNPSLTIAALSDRIADHIIAESPSGRRARTESERVKSSSQAREESSRATARRAGRSDHVREEVVSFTAADGFECNLLHLRGTKAPTKGPVIVVHGAGVRANIFRAPVETNFADYLVDHGYDVWLENWRASIDLEPNEWTLDQAALYDHPPAVEKVIEETGASSVQAVIHCQGSTSFAMSAVSGLLPRVRTIVSNAVSLHPVVPTWSKIKLNYVVPLVGRLTAYLNPRWNGETTSFPGQMLYRLADLTHRECDNSVCKQVSFYYGSGFPALWSHDNLNDDTHDWLREEFANVPISFYRQITEGTNAGRLVSTGKLKGLPADPTAGPPRTDARFSFFAGEDNLCFLPESQVNTHAYFANHQRDRHSLHVIPGYGHLDMFMGQYAARDVFPRMVAELDADNP